MALVTLTISIGLGKLVGTPVVRSLQSVRTIDGCIGTRWFSMCEMNRNVCPGPWCLVNLNNERGLTIDLLMLILTNLCPSRVSSWAAEAPLIVDLTRNTFKRGEQRIDNFLSAAK